MKRFTQCAFLTDEARRWAQHPEEMTEYVLQNLEAEASREFRPYIHTRRESSMGGQRYNLEVVLMHPDEYDKMFADLGCYKDEAEENRQRLDDLNFEIGELQAQVSNREENITLLLEQNRNLCAGARAYKIQYTEDQEFIGQLEATVQAGEETITQLLEENGDLYATNETLEARVRENQERLDDLNFEIENQGEAICRLTEDTELLSRENDNLYEENLRLKSLMRNAVGVLENARS